MHKYQAEGFLFFSLPGPKTRIVDHGSSVLGNAQVVSQLSFSNTTASDMMMNSLPPLAQDNPSYHIIGCAAISDFSMYQRAIDMKRSRRFDASLPHVFQPHDT